MGKRPNRHAPAPKRTSLPVEKIVKVPLVQVVVKVGSQQDAVANVLQQALAAMVCQVARAVEALVRLGSKGGGFGGSDHFATSFASSLDAGVLEPTGGKASGQEASSSGVPGADAEIDTKEQVASSTGVPVVAVPPVGVAEEDVPGAQLCREGRTPDPALFASTVCPVHAVGVGCQFFSLAEDVGDEEEENGLLGDLGEQQLHRSLPRFARWADACDEGLEHSLLCHDVLPLPEHILFDDEDSEKLQEKQLSFTDLFCEHSRGIDESYHKIADLSAQFEELCCKMKQLEAEKAELEGDVANKVIEGNELLSQLHTMQSNIGFTCEKEVDNRIATIESQFGSKSLPLMVERRLWAELRQLKLNRPKISHLQQMEADLLSFDPGMLMKKRTGAINEELAQYREARKVVQEEMSDLLMRRQSSRETSQFPDTD